MNLRKVLISVGSVIGLLIVTVVMMFFVAYNQAQDSKKTLIDQAKSKAIKDTPLTKVESASLFNGRNSFVSIKGKDEESKPLFAFIPQLNQKQNESDQKQPETHYVYADQGFTKDEIIKQWGSNCQNCDLDEVTIGMLNNRVVWEIIYERDNRLIFQTYRFDTGELYDSISFNQ